MSKKDDEVKSALDRWAEQHGTPKVATDPTRIIKESQNGSLPNAVPKPIRQTVEARRQEEMVINAIDDLRAMRRLAPLILKMQSGKMSVEKALKTVSPDALSMLLMMAFSKETSDKVQADVLKHILALSGHSATQKHQIERIDPNVPREALMAMIAGSKDELKKEGIEIVDDRDGEDKPEPIVDDDDEDYEA